MGKTVGQIDKELRDLEQQTATLATEFYKTYSSYLELLGQIVKQQLILASYHICTQVYPERFVRLQLEKRQTLQQGLQKAAKQVREHLQAMVQPANTQSLATDWFKDAVFLGTVEKESLEDTEIEAFLPTLLQKASEGAFGEEIVSKSSEEQEHQPSEKKDEPLKPKDLLLWQERLEKAIADSLDRLSREANNLLRHAKILPHNQLPEQVMEAAKSANSSDGMAAGSPNILTLLIEAENPTSKTVLRRDMAGTAQRDMAKTTLRDRNSPKKTETTTEEPSEQGEVNLKINLPMPIQIIEVYLRLAEIEFADPAVTSWRNQIRHLKTQLNSLGRQYQQKQRERAIAESEAAWRSSWYEDET